MREDPSISPTPAVFTPAPWTGGRRSSAAITPRRLLVHLALFLGAFYTVTLAGSFTAAESVLLAEPDLSSATALNPRFLVLGLPYSVCLLAILAVHEMGHYVACRRYGVDASLPYFLPGIPILIGTFGAFIRIRSPFPNRNVLFDIGVAGPIAGFLIAVPVLVYGIVSAQPVPQVGDLMTIGEPLLFTWLTLWLGPEVPAGHVILVSGPLMAGWVGCLVTATNLFPVGQLDGGHACYAISRRFHRLASIALIAAFVVMGVLVFPAWLVLATLLVAIGPKHPPVVDESVRLSRGRLIVGALCLLILVVCFIPTPLPTPDL